MLRIITRYGLVAGLMVGIPLFAITVGMKDDPPAAGVAIGYLIMLVALSTIFIAIKQHRDRAGGGVIRFWPALAIGLGISLVASLFYILAWELALAVTGLDFAGEYVKALVAQEEAKGVAGAELERFKAEMEAFARDYANPLFRIPVTFTEVFPVGALVSLVSAALLRNSRFLPARAA